MPILGISISISIVNVYLWNHYAIDELEASPHVASRKSQVAKQLLDAFEMFAAHMSSKHMRPFIKMPMVNIPADREQ